MLPRTEASAKLKRTEVTVSVAVGKVRLEIAALLEKNDQQANATWKRILTCSHPIFELYSMLWRTVDLFCDDR